MAKCVCAVELEMLEIKSFVRGFHAYKDIWTPEEGERFNLIREPENINDKYAVSVLKDGLIVGHVPYNLAPRISQFLKRDINKAFAEVKSKPINRGAGFWPRDSMCLLSIWT